MIKTFQDIVSSLNNFWSKQGCSLLFPHGIEVGAATSNPHTTIKSLTNKKWNVAYVEPSRRPTDGRYGKNPYRLQHYFQYQVIRKPIEGNNIEVYLKSLQTIGLDIEKHDVRFVEDNWENPSLGASGVGWEVWYDGMEISQYTYFQQIGGKKVDIPFLEISYGLERIAMVVQDVSNYQDIIWAKGLTYGEMYEKSEKQYSIYNFEKSNIKSLKELFDIYYKEARQMQKEGLYLVAYDLILKMSHVFNLLDARGVVGPSERHNSFSKMRGVMDSVVKHVVKTKRLK